jgi:hypothetical protein
MRAEEAAMPMVVAADVLLAPPVAAATVAAAWLHALVPVADVVAALAAAALAAAAAAAAVVAAAPNPIGYALFFCGILKPKEALGSCLYKPLEVLYRRADECADYLKERKRDAISHDTKDRYLGVCEFCNHHLGAHADEKIPTG